MNQAQDETGKLFYAGISHAKIGKDVSFKFSSNYDEKIQTFGSYKKARIFFSSFHSQLYFKKKMI
jgi:hypothetical protein